MDWHKVPEVMTGGKQYFYNCWIDGKKMYSVVWDRTDKVWKIYSYFGVERCVIGEVGSYKEGKRLVEMTVRKMKGEVK